MSFNFIILLYAFSGMMANIFYIPQIFLYVKQIKARGTISLITWGGWMFCGIIAFIYAVVEVQKIEMMIVTGFNAVAQTFIFGLGAWHRIKSSSDAANQSKAAFVSSAAPDNMDYLINQDSTKILIIMASHFSKVCRRFERRYFVIRKPK